MLLLLLAQGCAQERHQSGHVSPATCWVCSRFPGCFQRRLHLRALHTDLCFLDLNAYVSQRYTHIDRRCLWQVLSSFARVATS